MMATLYLVSSHLRHQMLDKERTNARKRQKHPDKKLHASCNGREFDLIGGRGIDFLDSRT